MDLFGLQSGNYRQRKTRDSLSGKQILQRYKIDGTVQYSIGKLSEDETMNSSLSCLKFCFLFFAPVAGLVFIFTYSLVTMQLYRARLIRNAQLQYREFVNGSNINDTMDMGNVTNISANDSKYWCYELRNLYPGVYNFSEITATDTADYTNDIEIEYDFHFHYLINPRRKCASHKQIFILSVVKSKVDNFLLRNTIRLTWGRKAMQGSNKIVFLLGSSPYKDVQSRLYKEAVYFEDIVLGEFLDNYYNNTYKTTMGFRWISDHCGHAKFVFLVDDDVMVNYKHLDNFFHQTPTAAEYSLFSGILHRRDSPPRLKSFKWFMPIKEYPYDCYPQFLSGCSILTTGKVVTMFKRAMPYVRKFKYDDVYLGIVAQKIGILPQNNPYVSVWREKLKRLRTLIASHGFPFHTDYAHIYRRITRGG